MSYIRIYNEQTNNNERDKYRNNKSVKQCYQEVMRGYIRVFEYNIQVLYKGVWIQYTGVIYRLLQQST